jgi:hypothetical protein
MNRKDRLRSGYSITPNRTVTAPFTCASPRRGAALKGVVTILNDDLGFLPGTRRAFPNGRVLMDCTGYHAHSYVRCSSNDLRNWDDLPSYGPGPWDLRLGIADRDAATGAPSFYRLASHY